MEQLYEDTMEKVCYLENQGFEVIQMWECELVKKDGTGRRYGSLLRRV